MVGRRAMARNGCMQPPQIGARLTSPSWFAYVLAVKAVAGRVWLDALARVDAGGADNEGELVENAAGEDHQSAQSDSH